MTKCDDCDAEVTGDEARYGGHYERSQCIAFLRAQVTALQEQVKQLEAERDESRRLHYRVHCTEHGSQFGHCQVCWSSERAAREKAERERDTFKNALLAAAEKGNELRRELAGAEEVADRQRERAKNAERALEAAEAELRKQAMDHLTEMGQCADEHLWPGNLKYEALLERHARGLVAKDARIAELEQSSNDWMHATVTMGTDLVTRDAELAQLRELLTEWLNTPFFSTREEWDGWVIRFRPRVARALGLCWQCGKSAVHEFRYREDYEWMPFCGARACGPVGMYGPPYGTAVRSFNALAPTVPPSDKEPK